MRANRRASMSELHQDPITADWVIISPERSLRPMQIGAEQPAICPFCPGHEALTAQTNDQIFQPDRRWKARAVASEFPNLTKRVGHHATSAPALTAGGLRLDGHGAHEVINLQDRP